MGGTLNAYTSHDLVAFHITVRAEAALEAIDLLTDFVGPSADRRRGARPRARRRHPGDPALQGPAVGRRRGADRPGRTSASIRWAAPCWAPRSTCARSRREAIVAFRERRWAGERGGAFVVGNVDHVPANGERRRAVRALPDAAAPDGLRADADASQPDEARRARDSNQSHLRMMYAPEVDATDPAQRAALTIYSTLLGGSMGSRLFDEIREQRGLCYSVYVDRPRARRRRDPAARRRAWSPPRCAEAYTRMREIVAELHADGPDRGGGRARARLRRRPPRPGLREHQRGRALRRHPGDRLRRGHRSRRARSTRSTRSPSTTSPPSARKVDPEAAAVACVGPHDEDEF